MSEALSDSRVERLGDLRTLDWLACMGWAIALAVSGDVLTLVLPRADISRWVAVIPTVTVLILNSVVEVSSAQRHRRAAGGIRFTIVLGAWLALELLGSVLSTAGLHVPF